MWFKLLLLSGILTAFSVAGSGTPLNKPLNYQGTQYRLTVSPSGRLENCVTGKTILFSSIELFGTYEHPGESYDARMFQGGSRSVSTRLEHRQDNRLRLVSSGTLGNAKIPEAAAFEQTTELEPDGFRISWQVTSKVPMKTHTLVFFSIMHSPIQSMIDRGIVAGSQRDQVIAIPAVCEPNKGLRQYGIGAIWFSLPEAVAHIVTGENSWITAIDCRGWGEPLFRLDIAPASTWKNDLEEYPAGTVWKWSVTFRFEPYED